MAQDCAGRDEEGGAEVSVGQFAVASAIVLAFNCVWIAGAAILVKWVIGA